MEIVYGQDIELSLVDKLTDQQSEKESKDASEDESKTDYFTDQISFAAFFAGQYTTSPQLDVRHSLTAYLEINSPPPEQL